MHVTCPQQSSTWRASTLMPKTYCACCWEDEQYDMITGNGGSCCCLCCAPAKGPEDDEGNVIQTSKWMPANPHSQEEIINHNHILAVSLFCPCQAIGQIWYRRHEHES